MAKSIFTTILIIIFALSAYSVSNFVTDSWIAFLVTNAGNAPKVSLHTAVLNPVNNTMLVMGGITPKGNASSIFIKYDVLADSWGTGINYTTVGGPPAIYGHVAVTTSDNKMFVYGGRDDKKVYGDIYKYDMELDIWEKFNVSGQPRWGHSGVMYSINNCLYFFGGQSTINGGYLNDIVKFDFERNEWISFSLVPTQFQPSPRSLHTSTLTLTNMMVVYGGKYSKDQTNSGTEIYNDLYIFSVEHEQWINATLNSTSKTPDYKYGHSAVLTPMGTILYYAGNQTALSASTSVWKYNIAYSSFEFISSASGLGPEARSGHTAIATLFNTMLVFGGQDDKVFYNNLFKYNIINSVLRSTSDGTTVVVLLSIVGCMIIGLCFALDIMAEKNEIARLEQLEKDAIAKNNEIALKKILQEKKDKLKNQPLFEKF